MVNAIALEAEVRYRSTAVAEIVLEHVTKVFSGDVVAVDDVSLEIESGEFLVLVGPSGCGKSTLLRMLAGLEEVTGGAISIDGRDVTELPPRSRDIAMVFQNYALYPHMTVRENLGYGLKVRKTAKPEISSRVDRVAELLGLDELLDRRPAALGVPLHSPAFLFERTSRDDEGRTVEYVQSVYRGDRYRIVTELSRPQS